MLNLITWIKANLARKPKAVNSVDLLATWRKHVRDWYVPMQLQATSVCAPFIAACEWQRENIQHGMLLGKQNLQQEFTALIKAMVVFNQYVKEEFFKWYVSQQGAEWQKMLEEQGAAKEYLAIAKHILEEATESTILASQQQAADLIHANELYETYTSTQSMTEPTIV